MSVSLTKTDHWLDRTLLMIHPLEKLSSLTPLYERRIDMTNMTNAHHIPTHHQISLSKHPTPAPQPTTPPLLPTTDKTPLS